MKVTKEQLKQIIREEIQQEGVFDTIKDFFKGRNRKFDVYSAGAEISLNRLKNYDENDKDQIERYIKILKDDAEKNLAFPVEELNSKEARKQRDLARRQESLIDDLVMDLDRLDRAAAAKARKEAAELEKRREEARERYEYLAAQAEERKRKREELAYRNKRAREEREMYGSDDADQFLRRHESKNKTGSKLTKEAIKQIIREEIKNAKGSK